MEIRMNKYLKSKTSLFLMELIITILLFAACGAVCVKLFVTSYVMTVDTIELNESVSIAQGFAEVMRGTDGDPEHGSARGKTKRLQRDIYT